MEEYFKVKDYSELFSKMYEQVRNIYLVSTEREKISSIDEIINRPDHRKSFENMFNIMAHELKDNEEFLRIKDSVTLDNLFDGITLSYLKENEKYIDC